MRRGVLGHVVDDDQRVLPAIAKVFRHREAGEGRNPLQAWATDALATTKMQRSNP